MNKAHDSINAGVFNKALKHDVNSTFIILSDWLGARPCPKENYKAINNPIVFWQKCGEVDCKFPSKSTARIDPALKLFPECPIMFTENIDVTNCLANGTQGIIKQIVTKTNPKTLNVGCHKVKYSLVSEVNHVFVYLPKHDR